VKREQCFTHSPVAPLCQIFERRPGPLAENDPLVDQKLWEWTLPIFEPNAPLSARVLYCVGPTRKAPWRPFLTTGRGENETIRFGSFEDDVRQGKQIGGPLEEVFSERATG